MGRGNVAAAGFTAERAMMGGGNHPFSVRGDTDAHLQLEDILIRPLGAPQESNSQGDDGSGDSDAEGGDESQGGDSWGCAVTGGNEGRVADAERSGGVGDQIEDEIMDDVPQGEQDHEGSVLGEIANRPPPTAPHLSRHVSRAYGKIRNSTLTIPEENTATQTRPPLRQNPGYTHLLTTQMHLKGGVEILLSRFLDGLGWIRAHSEQQLKSSSSVCCTTPELHSGQFSGIC